MKLLVTGGAGFIGSNFIRYMLTRYPKYQIVNLDLLTYAGNLASLADVEVDPRYTFVQGDIGNLELVSKVIDEHRIDTIVNFAAESHVDRSLRDPSVFVRTNVLGTQLLLEAAKNGGIRRFIQVSTDEVYGSLGPEGYFTETSLIAPNSPYAASKAGADMLVRSYHETFGLSVNITRCSNNYGPYQFPEKLIPHMITNALDGIPLPVYGDGLNVRDWLHVTDHASAIDAVLHRGRDGEVYNIGGNNEQKNIDIVKAILKQLDKDESLIRYVEDRLGHDRRYAIDPSKIEMELGWRPEITFETGLEETIRWYVDHSHWWRSISRLPLEKGADLLKQDEDAPLVSVIIALYNGVTFIRETLYSVFNQTYLNFEVIIVDDGSSDGSVALIAEHFPDIRVIRQSNQGAAAARNKGLSAARGAYVITLDQDDVLSPDFIAKMAERLAKERVFGVVANGYYIDSEGKRLRKIMKSRVKSFELKQMCIVNPIATPSQVMMDRIQLLELGGFDTELRGSEGGPVAEDWELWIRILKRNRLVLVDEDLVSYRIHESNSFKKFDKVLISELKIVDKAMADVRSLNLIKGYRYLFYSYKVVKYGSDYKGGFMALMKAVKFNPRLLFQPRWHYYTVYIMASYIKGGFFH